MTRRHVSEGFSAVELLVTLFIAAAFLVAGYQLYNVIVKDGGLARAQSRAANVAYDYLQRYSLLTTNPCTAATPLTNSPVNVSGLSSAQITIVISCPFSSSSGTNNAKNISRVQVTMTYNNPQQTVQYVTFAADTPSGTTSTTALSPPTGLSATATSTSQVNLSWTAPTDYTPTSYQVDYSTSSSFASTTTINNLSTTSTSITGLSPSTAYYFRVEALNLQGTVSQSSGTATANTYTNWGVYSLIAGVGDWNGDGKNDMAAYNPTTGNIDLHLGGGNATFGPAITLTNAGTNVRNIMGVGTPTGASAPFLFYVNNNTGPGYVLKSDGGTGISGSPIPQGSNWISYDSVFSAPKYYSNGTAAIIGKTGSLYIYSIDSTGTVTFLNQYGSGWSSTFPGNTVFGAGDFSGDGIGDIAAINTSAVMYLYYGTGTGTTGSAPNIGTGWVNNVVSGGWDFTGDGKTDMLRLYTPTNTLLVYQGNGAAGYGTPTTITVN